MISSAAVHYAVQCWCKQEQVLQILVRVLVINTPGKFSHRSFVESVEKDKEKPTRIKFMLFLCDFENSKRRGTSGKLHRKMRTECFIVATNGYY